MFTVSFSGVRAPICQIASEVAKRLQQRQSHFRVYEINNATYQYHREAIIFSILTQNLMEQVSNNVNSCRIAASSPILVDISMVK